MNHRRFRVLVIPLVFALQIARAANAADTFDYDPKYDAKAVWRESDVTLPNYPADHDLLLVPLAAADTFKLYVDRTSLSRAADRVARVTLVVESATGARNIFYEGIRCETREHKTYALGASDRAWRQQADPKWQFIAAQERNGFRYQLYKYYLCDSTNTARAPAEVLRTVADTAGGRY